MQDVEEGGNCVACGLANIRLLDQSVVEQSDGILLFLVCVASGILAFGLLAGGGAWDVKPHLHHLVLARSCLPALARGFSVLAVRFTIIAHGELDGDLVPPRQVGVGNLRVRNLEGGPVLHIEGQFSLAELCLSPVPSSQSVLLDLEVDVVPALEDLGETLVIVLLETIKLDDG